MGRLRLPGRAQAVGLEMDSGALKAVQISRTRAGLVLRHVGYHRLAPGAIEEGEVADHDLLAAEVKNFWGEHSFKGRDVYLGVANQEVIVRLLSLPRMQPSDLRSALSFEAAEHVPMPLEEAVIDHVVLGPDPADPDSDRVLLVAARREMVARYASAVRVAGLRPVGVDFKPLAISRTTLPRDIPLQESAALLVDIGTEMTCVAICEEDGPVLTSLVPLGAQDFVREISGVASIPEDEAEEQLMNPHIRLGFEPVEEPEETPDEAERALLYDIRRALEGVVGRLAGEVQRSIEYHYSYSGAREVSEMFVSGEGAVVPGIAEYMGDVLGIASRKGRPLRRFAANESNVSDEQLEVMEPVLAVAAGLALEE
ncbi:type IV pilus assembly protein PilM [Rubrobacter calidifluminis]|uniref:type IV pilus assembly protein PilM n=1 Tax=Rubrobacter calidifluminis TaxID=1392640 RepID=UPI00235E92EF|nr:type IV pilus assembly protein PilM [Rubrobacter calidifluminis]